MLTFHPVKLDRDLTRESLLYVGHFFNLKGMWWSKRKQRQGLVLSIAIGWYRLQKRQTLAPEFLVDEVYITQLTKQVGDARVILEKFFKINRIGFNFGNGNKSPTMVSPLKLGPKMIATIESIIEEVQFNPGLPPTAKTFVQTAISIKQNREAFIRSELIATGREDLLPAVAWLLKQKNLTFYYRPAGILQARDTSVWPIKAIEQWPGWLREALFGTVVDIENSYSQFLLSSLEEKYKGREHLLALKYPDIVRADKYKKHFRNELCKKYLKLEPNAKNITMVKKLIMSLANGSNATPALLTNGSGRSEAVRIVRAASPDLLPSELLVVGARLSSIAKQFKAIKRDVCIHLLKAAPTRANQRKIFRMYFDWEKQSRYKMWNAVGQSGLHLHDGIDGVITDMSNEELKAHIEEVTGVRVSVKSQGDKINANEYLAA